MQTWEKVKIERNCLVYLGYILAIVKYTFASTVFRLPRWCDISLMLAAMMCFMLYIVLSQVRGKAFLLFLVSLIVSLVVYMSNGHDDDLIITVIAIYALRGVDIDKIVSCYAAVIASFFVLVIGYSLITGENIGLYEGFRSDRGYEYRFTFGFIHPNSLQGIYLKMVSGLILTKWGQSRRKIKCVLFEIGNIILFLFSDSRTGFIVLTIVLFLCLCSKYIINKFGSKFFWYVMSGLSLFSVSFTIFASVCYKQFDFLMRISDLVTGRFDFANRFLTRFPISMFGRDIIYTNKYGYGLILDCGIINTLLHYGLLVFIVSLVIYFSGLKRMWKNYNYTAMIVVVGYIIYSVLENIFFNIFVNIGLILSCYLMVNKRIKSCNSLVLKGDIYE